MVSSNKLAIVFELEVELLSKINDELAQNVSEPVLRKYARVADCSSTEAVSVFQDRGDVVTAMDFSWRGHLRGPKPDNHQGLSLLKARSPPGSTKRREKNSLNRGILDP